MSTKPKVFICSTIYDFKDLRSAIRHYLQSLGFEPILSEFNDFHGPIDSNSYDTCADAIASCQYFILLIGSRVGGLYNTAEEISITRYEYRKAYDLLLKGQLKILSFVRTSIWDIKEDRRELEKYLKEQWQTAKELSEQDISAITNHGSSFVNDAKVIFSFINEVVRKEEMQNAQNGNNPRPLGNWIYQFDDFADIVNAMRAQLNISSPIGELIALQNLRRETLSNIRLLLGKSEDTILPTYEWGLFLKSYKLDDYAGTSNIPYEKLKRLLAYILIGFKNSQQLSTHYSHEIISSGQLQNLNHENGLLCYSKLGETVFQLIEQIDNLKRISTMVHSFKTEILSKYQHLAKIGGTQIVPFPNEYLFIISSGCDRQQDIMTLSIAIIRAIQGDDSQLATMKLNPIAPSQQMTKELERETPSITEIENWIKNHLQ